MTDKADFALIFAGGHGTRLATTETGGRRDKGLIEVAGRPFFDIVFERISQQAERIAVVAPEPPAWLEQLPKSVVHFSDSTDPEGRLAGPVAALAAGLKAVAEISPDAWVLTAPIDSPFLPLDLYQRLHEGVLATDARAALASTRGKLQPVFGLWRASIADEIADLFATKNLRALHRIAEAIGAIEVTAWDDVRIPPPFFNVNTEEELMIASDLAEMFL